ncbi:MAG TPA: sugar ABC transporter permease, partial [Ktedonobacteraceae bacterium]|nr:sugar ABC transporter permease [Ktedonobacteraceae bacterium]
MMRTVPDAKGRRPWYRRLTTREEIEFYLAISPWLIGFLLFTGGPIVAALLISLTQWQIIDTPKWVGLNNYIQMITSDPLFWAATFNTFYYVFLSVPLGVIVSIALAVLLNQKVRGVALFRTIYYLPSVTSGVAMAILWVWLFNPDVGLINTALRFIGIQGPEWLNSEQWSKPALVLMSLLGAGGNMIILLAGLQGIPEQLYEAAKLDGANKWQEFRHVTLPMLSPVVFFVVVVSTISAFQIFTNVYIISGGNGGPGTSTLVYVLYLYQNGFVYLKMGYA